MATRGFEKCFAWRRVASCGVVWWLGRCRKTRCYGVRMTTEDRLWTRQDVADYLGVHLRTVEHMAIPRIPITISGKRPIIRFDPEQVKAWVDARRTRKVEPAKPKAAAK